LVAVAASLGGAAAATVPFMHMRTGPASSAKIGDLNGPPKIPRILLPFPKPDALESAASGKMDNIIEAKELQIERKHFYVELRENDRGRFLRITEEAHGRRNSIIVPSTGVDDFTATIAEVLTNNDGAPA
jgi:hypothetical protein